MKPPKNRHALIIVTGSLILAWSRAALAEDPATLPDPCCSGPRIPGFIDGMATTDQGNEACETLIEEGWALVNPSDLTTPRRLEGEVVTGHPPHGDFYFNHKTEDHNFFVVPDNHNPMANDPNADYRYLMAYGNFVAGEPKEWGRIEVETEYGALPWNDAADNGYYGFPPFVWPSVGDRVLVEGFWTFDCGHEPCDGCFRSEIHPAWFVVTYRNMMQSAIARGQNRKGWVAPLGPDDRDFSAVTRADVYISSFGGEAVDNIFDDDVFYGLQDWWQPVNNKDYDFDIVAPPKPAGNPEATLTWRIIDPPGYITPPGASQPSFGDSNLTPFVRADGLEAVHVHVPMSQVPDADYMIFAKTILVGYDVSHADVRHFRVHVYDWYVYDDLEGPTQAEYSPWVNCRDFSSFISISNGVPDEGDPPEFDCDSDGNYMPYCNPDEDSSNIADTGFDVFIRGDDTLVLSFRAKEGEQPLAENDEAGFAEQAFTAAPAENFGVGTHHLRQNDQVFAGVYHESYDCDGPDGSCYEVRYTISQIVDPTAITIEVPAVQYAQDPNRFTARVVTPGSPDKPRRHLSVLFSFSGAGGTQSFQGVTADNGVAAPTDLLTLPAGDYNLTVSFAGSGLLMGSMASQNPVTIVKDFTASAHDIADKIRWGHMEPMTVTLIEPNVGQGEPALPISGKMMTINFTGPNGSGSFPAGPTGADGKATISPLVNLPPGAYQASACFAEDPWFLGSCSTPTSVKVTGGFAAYATGGPITIEGTHQTSLGDLHSEGAIVLSGNSHVLSAGAGERLEYATWFTDGSTGSVYNLFQVAPLAITPQYLASTYCAAGMTELMGVPITRISGNWKIPVNAVLNGIYCVGGNLKIQSGVSGSAVLVAGGTITTSGGGQNLTTADPTGADVLMIAGSIARKALTLDAAGAIFRGALVARGGVEVSSMNTLVDTALIGQTITVKGSNNVLDGRPD